MLMEVGFDGGRQVELPHEIVHDEAYEKILVYSDSGLRR